MNMEYITTGFNSMLTTEYLSENLTKSMDMSTVIGHLPCHIEYRGMKNSSTNDRVNSFRMNITKDMVITKNLIEFMNNWREAVDQISPTNTYMELYKNICSETKFHLEVENNKWKLIKYITPYTKELKWDFTKKWEHEGLFFDDILDVIEYVCNVYYPI